jgi:hypothetical protein
MLSMQLEKEMVGKAAQFTNAPLFTILALGTETDANKLQPLKHEPPNLSQIGSSALVIVEHPMNAVSSNTVHLGSEICFNALHQPKARLPMLSADAIVIVSSLAQFINVFATIFLQAGILTLTRASND